MTTFNKSKPMPKWLGEHHENKATERGRRYYLHIWKAQPIWADRKRIRRIYAEARERREQGEDIHVDHIFPLIHPAFCGLHIASNLRIIDAGPNISKSNIFYPGHEQLDFWIPEFFELEMRK